MSTIKNAAFNAADKISSTLNNNTSARAHGANSVVLVTGAWGFVAAHVLNLLLERGYSVRGTVRSQETADKVRKTHAKHADKLSFVIVKDIADENALDAAAFKDVGAVIHTASPFVLSVEDNERDLLDPAIKGTKAVLSAIAKHAPQVRRVVITSSFASIMDVSQGARPGYTYTEKDWNPITYEEAKSGDGGAAYCASKTFAEKAAWDFVKDRKPNFDIATICPPMIYGPLEHSASLDHLNTSSADIYRFMNGSQKEPGATAFPAFADVRDVGEAHVNAMERPQAANQRYFITSGNFQYADVCEIIRQAVPSVASKVPDPSNAERAETFKVDNSKAIRDLGIKFRSLRETIGDAAKSLERLQTASA